MESDTPAPTPVPVVNRLPLLNSAGTDPAILLGRYQRLVMQVKELRHELAYLLPDPRDYVAQTDHDSAMMQHQRWDEILALVETGAAEYAASVAQQLHQRTRQVNEDSHGL